MIIPSSSTIAFRMSFWTAAIASLLSALLISILRYQRYRKRHPKGRTLVTSPSSSFLSTRYRLWNQVCTHLSSLTIILPVYEPILWVLSIGFLIQALLLGTPGPYPMVPSWFLGASYSNEDNNTTTNNSSASPVNLNNEGFINGWLYFVYWFTFEVMSEGFGIVLLWKYPSKEVFLSSLKYAVLYGSMSSGLTTLGFNWYLLGVNQNIQSILDSIFVGTPCLLYSLLLIFDRCIKSQRNSIRVYAVFALIWRLTSLIAVVTGSYSTLLGASITLFRSICMPLVMYLSLILETNYWRNLAGTTVRKLDTFTVITPSTDTVNTYGSHRKGNNTNDGISSPSQGRYRSSSQYSTGSAVSTKSRSKNRSRIFEREASFRDVLETSGVPMTRSSLYSRSSMYDRQKELDDENDDNKSTDYSTDKENIHRDSNDSTPRKDSSITTDRSPIMSQRKPSYPKPRALTSDGTFGRETDLLTITTDLTLDRTNGHTVGTKPNRSASDEAPPLQTDRTNRTPSSNEPSDDEFEGTIDDEDHRPRTSGSLMVRRRKQQQQQDNDENGHSHRYQSPLAKKHKYLQHNKRLIAVSPGGAIKSITDNSTTGNMLTRVNSPTAGSLKKKTKKIPENLQIPEWGTLKNTSKDTSSTKNTKTNSLSGAAITIDITPSDPSSLGITPPILLTPATNMVPLENNLLSYMFGGTLSWFGSKKKEIPFNNAARNKLLNQESLDPNHVNNNNGMNVPVSLSGVTVSTDDDSSSRNTTPYSSKPSTRTTLATVNANVATVSTPGIQLQTLDSAGKATIAVTNNEDKKNVSESAIDKNKTGNESSSSSSVWKWFFGISSKSDKVPLLPSGSSSSSGKSSSYGTGSSKNNAKPDYPSDDEQIDNATLIHAAKRMQRKPKENNDNNDYYDDDNDGDDDVNTLQSAEGFFKQRAAEMLGPRRRQGLRNADIDTVAQFENDNSQYLVDFVDLEIGEYMDKGGTSLVYVGRYKGDSVAIKIFRPDRIDEHVIAFFHKENAISAAFVHPAIVRYYGLCVSPPTISLVFELCPRGSLYNLIDTLLEARREDEYDREHGLGDYAPGGKFYKERLEYIRQQQQINKNMLMNNNGRTGTPTSNAPLIPSTRYTLSWRRKLRMARDGAAALAYLHSFDPPYLHRDVKSQNFLITQDYHMKLSDFGESRVSSGRNGIPMTGEIGTTHWMAPEMLRGEAYTEAVDIYGFGIVLWEIAMERHPYDNLPERQIVYAVSVRGVRPPIPTNCPPSYAKLMQACWDTNPSKRPSAEEVLAALESMNPPE